MVFQSFPHGPLRSLLAGAATALLARTGAGLLLVWLLGACAGGTVALAEPEFPSPAVTPLQLDVAIHYTEAFSNYALTEEIERQGSYELSVGPAQIQLFDTIGRGLFASFMPVADTAPESLTPFDVLIVPTIRDLEFAIPANNTSNFYEIRIRYLIEMLQPDGRKITNIEVIAYGKSRNLALDNDEIALRSALHTTLRDAGADFLLKFMRSRQVRQWLRTAAVPVPASWPEPLRR